MFGIILKDIKNVRSQIWYYGVMLLVFFAISIVTANLYFYAGCIVFFAVALPVSALAYDEKDNWDKFVLAAGIGRKQVVGARYVLSVMTFLPLWLICFLFLIFPKMELYTTLTVIFFYGAIGLLTADIIIPLIFSVGVEKARTIYIVMILFVLLLGAGIAYIVSKFGGLAVLSVSLGFFLLAVIGFYVSLKISQHVYSNKDF